MRPPADTGKQMPADTGKRVPADTGKRAPADTTKGGAIPRDVIPFLPLPRSPDDTTHTDSVPPAAKRVVRDSIKTAIVRPFEPRTFEVGANGWHWDRDEIFASGALTLGELLANVPGITLYATGFILAPQAAAWNGDPGGVRLFVDGVALDAINARNGGIPDLTTIPIWALEDVLVERAAGEVRVYMRTWRVERTTASTRTDVMTGSENLNFYRGFFGKRFDNGLAIQAAGQQLSTISRAGADGDGLGMFGRIGWAKGSWSVDVTALRQGINRSAADRYQNTTAPIAHAMPGLTGAEGVTYARVAWRDPQKDVAWVQFIAAASSAGGHDSTGTAASANPSGIPSGNAPTTVADTVTGRTEYTFAAGVSRWGIRVATIDRLRSAHGQSLFAPGVRIDYDWKLLSVGAAYDKSPDASVITGYRPDSSLKPKSVTDTTKIWVQDSTARWRTTQATHTDAFARVTPWSWLQLGASWSRVAPQDANGLPPTVTTRFEGALRWHDRWLTVGTISRGVTTLAPPVELDGTLRRVVDNAASGITVGFRGPAVFGWGLDVQGVQWQTASWYRPKTEVRTTLKFSSSFLGRFPRGNFHLLVAGTHEYRGQYFVPADSAISATIQPGYSVLSALLEVRIGDATITYQVRNPVGLVYTPYPGYMMPRIVNLYGVRWAFWN